MKQADMNTIVENIMKAIREAGQQEVMLKLLQKANKKMAARNNFKKVG